MVEVDSSEVRPNIFYAHNPVHRNRTRRKSQWTISANDEIVCFCYTFDNFWLLDTRGWGFHLQDGVPQYLGLAQDHVSPVFIAKFVDKNANSLWHGYPADHQRNPADIPDLIILKRWLGTNILGPAKIRKIMRGQPCDL